MLRRTQTTLDNGLPAPQPTTKANSEMLRVIIGPYGTKLCKLHDNTPGAMYQTGVIGKTHDNN